VGNGNIDVGNKSSTRKPGQPIAQRLVGSNDASEPRIDKPDSLPDSLPDPLKANRPGVCGAMSEQRCDGGRGTESAPQEFLQLVGWRDSKIRPDPWVRPHVTPVKR
jgi:hypothetical protein